MAQTVERFVLDTGKDTPISLVRSTLDMAGHTEAHTHSVLEFSMILAGSGEYRVEQRIYPVAPGDIVLFNNTERHSMWNTGDALLVNASLEFEPRFVWENLPSLFDHALLNVFFRRSERFSHKLDRRHPAFAAVQQQLGTIRTLFEKKPPRAETLVYIRLLNILADLLQYYPNTVSSAHIRHRPSAGMEQVLRYISQHYHEPIPLATLACIMNVNKTYFSQLFRECNGMGPKEYIVKTRVAAAARLLRSSDRVILDIAQSCGFNSPSNFYAAFKRITGKSPTQYRQCPLD